MHYQVEWSPGMTLEALELEVIDRAYSFFRGNKTKTAESLGIAVRTLDTKLDGILKVKAEKAAAWEESVQRDREFKLRCGFTGEFKPVAPIKFEEPTGPVDLSVFEAAQPALSDDSLKLSASGKKQKIG